MPPPKKERNWLKGCLLVTLGVILGGAVLIVGCFAVIGAGVDEAEKEQNRQGITLSEFRSIEQGTSQPDVEAQLGEPADSQEFEQEIPELQDQPSRSSCIYYPEKNQPLFEGRSFQFCFDEGKLTSKNAY
jgi:adenine-specific DNA methylase